MLMKMGTRREHKIFLMFSYHVINIYRVLGKQVLCVEIRLTR